MFDILRLKGTNNCRRFAIYFTCLHFFSSTQTEVPDFFCRSITQKGAANSVGQRFSLTYQKAFLRNIIPCTGSSGNLLLSYIKAIVSEEESLP